MNVLLQPVNVANGPTSVEMHVRKLETYPEAPQSPDPFFLTMENTVWRVFVCTFLGHWFWPSVSADNCVDMLTANLPGMWERTVTIGSGGKSFSATGWKVTRNHRLLAFWGRSSVQFSTISFLLCFFNFRLGGPLAVETSSLF